jgi:hypothetical protein
MTSPKLPRTPQELGAAADKLYFDAKETVNAAVDSGVLNVPTSQNAFTTIPVPRNDVDSLTATTAALKAAVEALIGTRGDKNNSAVKVGDLVSILDALHVTGVKQSNSSVAAAVEDQIVDGVTTIAPSQNAVFDAIAALQAQITENSHYKRHFMIIGDT